MVMIEIALVVVVVLPERLGLIVAPSVVVAATVVAERRPAPSNMARKIWISVLQ